MSLYGKELRVAVNAARKAGKAIMEIYSQKDFHIVLKGDNSPLTEADNASNEIILASIIEHFPEDSFLSEESTDDLARLEKDRCWLVDPLDGTKEFLKRNGEFTVNIALTFRKNPVMGVVYLPVNDVLYYAVAKNGAFVEKDNVSIPIHTSSRTSSLRLMTSRSHISSQLQHFLEEYKELVEKTMPAGSSLKGCLVAEGTADIYYRFGPTMEWDTAAMHCVVEEAGGIVRQMDGSLLQYNREDSKNHKGFYMVNRKENIFFITKKEGEQ